jgi:hypothetical protein
MKRDPVCFRMQADGELECRGEFPFQKDAGHARRQGTIAQLSSVDPAEDDSDSGKDFFTMTQEEVQRRFHHGHDHISLPGCKFCAKVVAQKVPVRIGIEPGEVHRFAVDLNALRPFGAQRAGKTGVEHRQPRQVGALVIEHDDLSCLRKRRQCAGAPDNQRRTGESNSAETDHPKLVGNHWLNRDAVESNREMHSARRLKGD